MAERWDVIVVGAGSAGLPGAIFAAERGARVLQVLRPDGLPIPNLYAAGEVIGVTRVSGKGFAGGMSLTPALTFGRLLGQRMLDW